MQYFNVTIGLILAALASTTISLFWANNRNSRLLLFSLAVAASLGAILQAYDDDVRLRHVTRTLEETSARVQHLVISNATLPVGFHDKLAAAVASVAEREGYGWSRVWTPDQEWAAGDFGYLLGFDDPSETDSHPEYLDFLYKTGYEHGFVYIPKDLVIDLVLETLKGEDITNLLHGRAFWKWRDVTDLNPTFRQSVTGIIKKMYLVATAALPPSLKFLENPETIQARFDEDGSIDVVVKVPEEDCLFIFAFTDKDFLRRLVDVNAILRGGRIAAHFLEKLMTDFADEKRLLICEG